MKNAHKYGYLFLFLTLLLLCLSMVSAQEPTKQVIKEENTTSSVIKEDIQTINTQETINKNYNTQTKTATKKPTNFDIKIRNNIVDNSTIEVGVIDSNNEKAIPNSPINITLPDKTKINTKTLKTGYVNVTMKLPYGNNTVHLNYPGNNNYSSYNYDLNLNVVKRNASMNINIERTNETGEIDLTIKLTDAINNEKIKNAKTTVTLPNGKTLTQNTNNNAEAKYNFKLEEGKHKINVTFPANTKYNQVKSNFTLEVGKAKNNVDYDVELNNQYVGKTSITITLKDYTTRKTIPNTQLKLKINNQKTITAKTDKNGKLTTNLDIPVGKNYVDITFAGNNNYYERTSKINFTVNKRVSDMDFTLTTPTTPKLNITLTDLVLNKTINNAPVTITLPNGEKVTKTTNNKGQIIYPITPQTGSKKYTATYNGNTNTTNITRTLTVQKPTEKTPVTYNVTVTNKIYQDDSVTFTLIDTKTNKTIANSPLTIKLKDQTITGTTNKKGEVTINKKLKIGTNNVTMTYKGNTKYQNSTKTVQIKIDKRPSTINSTIHTGTTLGLNLTLTDAINHKAIPNAKITLKHPKTNITLTTDKNGKVITDVKLPAGKAEISLKYNGNSIYTASNVKPTNITITTPKTPTKITVNKITGTIGDKVTLTANIKDIKGNKITTGNIVFKLNGKTLKTDNVFGSKQATKKIAVKNGKATVTLTATKTLKDAKNITATYAGTSKYYYNVSKPVKPQIQSRNAKIVVTATPKTQQQYQTITFKVKVTDTKNKKIADNKNSYVIFKVNGKTITDKNKKTVKVQIKNQTATYKYTVPKGTAALNTDKTTRKHVVTAVFYNPDYNSAKNTTNFQVKRSTTKFNITTTQYTKKTRTLTIKGNIKDYKNYNVAGDTKINIKINGKTITQNGKTVNYTIKSGKISLTIKVPTNIQNVNNVTLISGDRLAYTKATYTVKKIKQI